MATKKSANKKKANKVISSATELRQHIKDWVKEDHAVINEPISEMDFLSIFIDNFEKYDKPTKIRLLAYINDKYSDYKTN